MSSTDDSTSDLSGALSIGSDTLLENLQVALILLDQHQVVQIVNIAAETLFERSRRHLIGSPVSEILPLPKVQECIVDCLQNNAQYTLRELAFGVDADEALVDITISPVSDAGGIQSAVLLELSSINRISRFIKETNQLERQQSFRLMMRSLAHEIKNPLGGLRGAAQLLGREIEGESHQELISILIKEADRLTNLVDRVMGSREQLKPEAVNIHEILEHVVKLVGGSHSVDLDIRRSYDPALPDICGDKEQLIQAVLNIVGNAIQAQQADMRPVIGLVTQFERSVTINHKLHRSVVKLQIWDEGPGVPEALRDIIFDPLITGRPEGTGLGLSITQEIVQRHFGVVKLDEYSGKTCFTVYLPYAQANDHLDSNGSAL